MKDLNEIFIESIVIYFKIGVVVVGLYVIGLILGIV
jgi:hypothetical protein